MENNIGKRAENLFQVNWSLRSNALWAKNPFAISFELRLVLFFLKVSEEKTANGYDSKVKKIRSIAAAGAAKNNVLCKYKHRKIHAHTHTHIQTHIERYRI